MIPLAIDGITPKEKLESLMKVLEQGVKDVFTSGKYQEYLTVMSRFHHYSYRNCMLILLQMPEATRVAGFGTWTGLKRSVIKGAKGIRILAPIISKKKDDNPLDGFVDNQTSELVEPKKTTSMYFRVVSVFDVSQTTGEDLPTLADELRGDWTEANDVLEAIRQIAPCPIELKPIAGAAKGFYSRTAKRIVIREGMAPAQTIKTAIHELAHARLHDPDNRAGENVGECTEKNRAIREVEAESIAFVVLHSLGLDTSDYSFGYLAGWSSDDQLKELQAAQATIQKEADLIIKAIAKARQDQPVPAMAGVS
jgi:hypothetical protein